MLKHTTVLVVLFLLLTAPVSAQRGKWRQDERSEHELGLTAKQNARLEEVSQENLTRLRKRMKLLEQA